MMTNWEFEIAKRAKMEEVSYIAAEIIALSILEERNYTSKENGEKTRLVLLRDNAGFGDKRKWCMRFFDKESKKSAIFHLASTPNPHDWVCAAMEKIPPFLDKFEASLKK